MADTPPFSPTVTLLTIGRMWEAAMTAGLKPLGLTTRTYGLLGHVRGAPGISFSELARRSRITVQSAHTAVGALQSKGWVDDPTAQAGASSTLQVTDAGTALLTEAAQVVEALDAEFSAAHPELTEALRAHLGRLMSGPA